MQSPAIQTDRPPPPRQPENAPTRSRPPEVESRDSFYRTVLESLAEGVLITDPENRIFYANGVVTDITGYRPEELLGSDLYQVLFSAPPRKVEPDQECSTCAEVELRRKDGHMGWVYLRTTAYRNEAGEVAGTIMAMSCIHQLKTLELENEVLQEEVRKHFGSIIGESPALRKVISQIATVAPTEATVLILGESGTGKELVAHAIHERSDRKGRPLVRVNCASIPKELFESEFFGHVRGAFTSAVRDRVGRFELADRGTLFLDEVGEIPLDLQGKLLRVLQEGQFERLGDERTRTVDVRIIAATNRDLLAEARAGRFRLDLYYRLSVFPIDVPPLRDRIEDVRPLAEAFTRDAAVRLAMPVPRLTRTNLRDLEQYDWPGNVRELQNVIERAVILAKDGRLEFDLPQRPREGGWGRATVARQSAAAPASDDIPSLDELVVREREIVSAALERCGGKIYGADGAAALLKVKPTTLVSMAKRLGLARSR
ncbi:MAG: sigma 54-interacting transcriptional regulator [Opitutaceae bacterium]|nr:sigma 54-interacting transcriptional regulator [Opitutaceae bacterium]